MPCHCDNNYNQKDDTERPHTSLLPAPAARQAGAEPGYPEARPGPASSSPPPGPADDPRPGLPGGPQQDAPPLQSQAAVNFGFFEKPKIFNFVSFTKTIEILTPEGEQG